MQLWQEFFLRVTPFNKTSQTVWSSIALYLPGEFVDLAALSTHKPSAVKGLLADNKYPYDLTSQELFLIHFLESCAYVFFSFKIFFPQM